MLHDGSPSLQARTYSYAYHFYPQGVETTGSPGGQLSRSLIPYVIQQRYTRSQPVCSFSCGTPAQVWPPGTIPLYTQV